VRVYIATKNPGKLRELAALLAGSKWEPVTYEGYRDVVEGDESYAANAALKAEALRAQLFADGIAAAVLGDDSGIEVTALGGRPGIHSARYAGPGATWADRRALLRDELAATGSADRSARFVCSLHFIDATGHGTSVEADVAGTISPEDRGDAGFSYDAAFWYPPLRKTFAELTEEEKNHISHRARAVAALIATV
jgi:XTP/dITP diphosphohydrolase